MMKRIFKVFLLMRAEKIFNDLAKYAGERINTAPLILW
jgi:hypothetical protein